MHRWFEILQELNRRRTKNKQKSFTQFAWIRVRHNFDCNFWSVDGNCSSEQIQVYVLLMKIFSRVFFSVSVFRILCFSLKRNGFVGYRYNHMMFYGTIECALLNCMAVGDDCESTIELNGSIRIIKITSDVYSF